MSASNFALIILSPPVFRHARQVPLLDNLRPAGQGGQHADDSSPCTFESMPANGFHLSNPFTDCSAMRSNDYRRNKGALSHRCDSFVIDHAGPRQSETRRVLRFMTLTNTVSSSIEPNSDSSFRPRCLFIAFYFWLPCLTSLLSTSRPPRPNRPDPRQDSYVSWFR